MENLDNFLGDQGIGEEDRELMDSVFREFLGLSSEDLSLPANMAKFGEDPAPYLSGRLDMYRRCYESAKGRLSTAYETLEAKRKREDSIREGDHVLSEDGIGVGNRITKIISTISSWFNFDFRPLRSSMGERIESMQTEADIYGTIKTEIDSLNSFLRYILAGNQADPQGGIARQLEECIGLTADIASVYSKLAHASQETADAEQRMYAYFFNDKRL